MTNVLDFRVRPPAPAPANDLLDRAKLWGMDTVLVVGFDDDGDLCFGGNITDQPMINFMLDKAKQSLLSDEF